MSDNEYARQELDLRLIRIIRKMADVLFENLRNDINRYGLDAETFQIFELLYSKGPLPIQKISEKLKIPSGSITYVVDKLEKKAFVQRASVPGDRRKTNVMLTEEGQVHFADIFPKHAQVISENLSSVTDEEKLVLIALLKKIGYGASESQS
ncbi:MarR family transcriptional regulator [Paenibacillus psychroresistens]|uniref:MarR family transcriptional regulator n=1 Tax=Paenibacillus psychroresistens TaxID=1778678 RepID=A0A6B8RLI1_9BACL|nr:MarR family transcriptional regulator [Paenibacillus psychroresistens]QGQ97251.1 MarR family transcriptional regulator [Paenibacillus psychroresistens]